MSTQTSRLAEERRRRGAARELRPAWKEGNRAVMDSAGEEDGQAVGDPAAVWNRTGDDGAGGGAAPGLG